MDRDQREEAAVPHPGIAESAPKGFAGTSTELPHRAAIEASYGVDLGHVQAYLGAGDACNDMGAEAYAQGNQIAFASDQPSLQLAAHEAAHVVQQASGVHLQSRLGVTGDSHEQQADAAADRAVRGESAEAFLPGGGLIDPSSGGAIQRYSKPDENWRVSDDGEMAVHQKSAIGGKTAYASPGKIASAAAELLAATSSISLEAGGETGTFQDQDGKEHQLVDVVPVNTVNGSRDLEMQLWADCGRSAHTVSGIDGGNGQGGGGTVAKYEKDGETKQASSAADWMEIQKVKMMVDLFTTENPWWKIWKPKYETKLDTKKIQTKLDTYNRIKASWAAEANKDTKKVLAQQMAGLARELDELSRAEYEKLSPDAKDDFDKHAGINVYADPDIGEAFHMSTGGNEHPDKPANVGTWNFHWAGVVMKSGSDTMTLENYSVSDYNKENKRWVFQMYGVGKKGQSFHDEHKDVHKQHGDAPTTMVAARE